LRRNCLLKHVIEGVIVDVTGRRGIRCKELLDDLKENIEYWKLKGEALYICGELALEKVRGLL
jgi:hypothetical protein